MGLSARDCDTIRQALAAPDVAAAFSALLPYPDLRHGDLPRLKAPDFAALRADPRQARGFALGFAAPSPGVRRFCKRYLAHAGPDAADGLFALLLETVDALRPGAGVLGSFHGVASPVGGYVRSAGLSLAEPAPPRVYSDAESYGRDVVEPAVEALVAVAPERALQLAEFVEALVRSPLDREPPAERRWAGELELKDAIHHSLKHARDRLARKGDPALLRALAAWARRELALAGADPGDLPLELARARFASLGEDDRAVAKRRLRWAAASALPDLPRPARDPVYAALVACSHADPGSPLEEAWVARGLGQYEQRCPGDRDWDDARRLAARATVRRLEEALSDPSRSHPPLREHLLAQLEEARAQLARLEGAAPAPAAPEAQGPQARDVVDALETLTRLGGCGELWRDAVRVLGLGTLGAKPAGELPPEAQAARPALERLLAAADRAGEGRVPEATLEAEAEPVLGLILALCEARRPALPDLAGSEPFRDPTPAESELSALLAAGMQVLPEAGLEALATWLRVHAQPGHLFHYGRSWHSAADALLERGLLAPGLFAFVLGARRPRNETDEQRILWQLYTHPDPRGAELVREVVAALPLPRPDDYVSGVPWKQPWQGLQTRAWETGDLTLLAACFERCALQTWSKGAKAFLPEVRTPVLEGWQANSVPTDGGVPLEEVWAAVRDADPERAPRILAALLACAEADELPAQVLRIAARDSALLAHGYRFAPGALLDLVESPGARAVNLGLELLLAQPEAAAGMTLALVDAAARHLRGAASGPAKAAARALGVLAAAEADARPAALEALGDALFASQAPRVEAALRALGALAKAAPLALSAEVQARLRALSDGPHAKQATGVLAQVQV